MRYHAVFDTFRAPLFFLNISYATFSLLFFPYKTPKFMLILIKY